MPRRTLACSIRLLDGFDDHSINELAWQRVLAKGETDTVFLTRWWQKTWWESFGRGQLLLLGMFREGDLVGLAPLFADSGMVFFTGSGGSDYLDFIGEIPDHAEMLAQAIKKVPDFVGFRFYHVPDKSGTGMALHEAAQKLGLVSYDEGDLPAPVIDLNEVSDEIVHKKKLLRYQRFFEREGAFSVRHFNTGREILPRLEAFFEQHITRWTTTPCPSLFLDQTQRRFYEALARSAQSNSSLRFSELGWNEIPIAFHFGFSYGGTYIYYKPSFAIELAKRSPGMVLMRNVLLAAMDEGCSIFDMGLGAEAYKGRFATRTQKVRTWGLYPHNNNEGQPGLEKGKTP